MIEVAAAMLIAGLVSGLIHTAGAGELLRLSEVCGIRNGWQTWRSLRHEEELLSGDALEGSGLDPPGVLPVAVYLSMTLADDGLFEQAAIAQAAGSDGTVVVLSVIVATEYRGSYWINLTFNDGQTGTVDVEQWLEGPVFRPLKDVDYFARFYLEGGTVVWPNGADIAPETLHEAVRSTKAA